MFPISLLFLGLLLSLSLTYNANFSTSPRRLATSPFFSLSLRVTELAFSLMLVTRMARLPFHTLLNNVSQMPRGCFRLPEDSFNRFLIARRVFFALCVLAIALTPLVTIFCHAPLVLSQGSPSGMTLWRKLSPPFYPPLAGLTPLRFLSPWLAPPLTTITVART